MYERIKASGLLSCAFLASAMFLASTGLAQEATHHHNNHISCNGLSWEFDGFDLDVDDDMVIVTSSDRHRDHDRSIIEINGEYDLFIDGDLIAIDDNQRELLKEFHTEAVAIEKEAHLIAEEGARIGIKGAKLGLEAMGKVIRLLSPEYDADDLEREMDREAAKIELEAQKIEEQAEKIEDMADDLEDQTRDLRQAIPELREIRWF
jgi:hypothetical protein